MKLFFIVNPISGGVNKEPFLNHAQQLCNRYGTKLAIFRTTGKNDKEQLTQILEKEQPDKVAAVGGDGTVLFATICLLDSGLPLGIIPQGSANGMAKELHVNTNPIEALKDIIMSEVYADMDLLRVNSAYYSMHIGDVGINANLVKSFSEDPRRGMMTYAKYFFEKIKNAKAFPVRVVIDGETIEDMCYMAAICNSGRYGTGVILNKQSNLFDGKFEIVLLRKKGIKLLIEAGLTKFNESFYSAEHTRTFSGSNARLYFDEPRVLQLDGEIIEEFAELEVELLKGAVRIISS